MADDIDIEEHDVLDNPRIKNIFPDITCIKKEVIDYEEETAGYQEDTENYENYEYLNEYDEPVPPMEYESEVPSLYQSRIILGSKPCRSPTPSDCDSIHSLQDCVVVLYDWGPILENSPYCSSCQILFPTENALDYHKMAVHSFLVAVSNNKAVKSTSKSSLSALNASSSEGVFCNHCDEVFPDENAFLKHRYELLPSKFECDQCNLHFQSDIDLKSHQSQHISADSYMSCPICSCLFKSKGFLLLHLQRFHNITDKKIKTTIVTDFKCRFCTSHFNTSKTYNGHIYYRHRKLYVKKIGLNTHSSKSEPYNVSSQKIHPKHGNTMKSEQNPMLLDVERSMGPIAIKRNSECRPIPKSTLFGCNKCQIHFVSCLVAVEHSKKCVLKKGDWKCIQCRRSFKMADRAPHLRQHEHTERLKVIRVRDNISDRILCKCVACKVCYDEKSLYKYHSFSCPPDKTVFCSDCQVQIHAQAYPHHSRLHTDAVTSCHFIIINFVMYDESKAKPKPTPQFPKLLISKKKYANAYYFYYCPSCKGYMKLNKSSDNHNTGRCKKSLPKCICKLCGLCFTLKSYQSHKDAHKVVPNLKLMNMKFYNTQTGAKLDPPFPIFKKCPNCSVCFYSSIALRGHVCNGEDVKICGYCDEKLSDLAYKLHLPFHEYRKDKRIDVNIIPELIKKYESLKTVWNILFVCSTCETAVDAYDDMVEHCQDHFCNMENYNVTINNCDICDFNFMGKSFERHNKLHAAGDINKNSFEIIKYNYEKLLADKWFEIFTALTPEVLKQVLHKSIYKDTRGVRMSVLVNNDSDFTVYKCGICQVAVDSASIAQYVHDPKNCARITKYPCSCCNLQFPSKNMVIYHEMLHKIVQLKNSSFRVISFNNEKDSYVNNSLKSMTNPEELKFIRCQHCGKLINKRKYSKHMSYHKSMDKRGKEGTSAQPKFVIRPKYKTHSTGNSANTFYRCKKCNVCVFKQNVKIHFCSEDNQKKRCPKCNLWFRASCMQKHYAYHEKHKFTKNNVKVINFRNGKEDKDHSKMVLHQCTQCSACLHHKANILRHKCVSESYLKTCNLCEAPVRFSHFYLHRQFHKNKSFSRKSLVIIKFDPVFINETLLGSEKYKNTEAANTLQHKRGAVKLEVKVEPDESMQQDSWLDTSEIVNETDIELCNKSFFKRIAYRYYRCDKCKVFFVTGAALFRHVQSCEEDRNRVVCDCGFAIHWSALNLHKKWQKCGFPGFYIYVMSLTHPISQDNDTFDLKKCLYKCNECDLNYLCCETVIKHFEANHNTSRDPAECDKCNIRFTSNSNTRHKKLHHDTHNWSLSDLNRFEINKLTLKEVGNDDAEQTIKRKVTCTDVIPNKVIKTEPIEHEEPVGSNVIHTQTTVNVCGDGEIYTCDVCDLSFVNKNTLASHNSVGKHKMDNTVACTKCNFTFTPKSYARHLNMTKSNKTEQDTDHSGSELNIKEESLSEPSDAVTQIENMFKLFKCGECDVYFLTLDVCNDHIVNHQDLDPTEYIACKVCELQFLCENLGAHMKGHRNKTFNIDNLIVKEFYPNRETVDTYLAVDRLKAKAVSTTTHFDTEDEKCESVDSASTVR